MANDTNNELERIEQALLEEDGKTDAPTQTIPVPESVEAYNTDNTDISPDDLSDQLQDSGKHSLTGILILVLLMTLAILGAIGWYLLKHWGYLA